MSQRIDYTEKKPSQTEKNKENLSLRLISNCVINSTHLQRMTFDNDKIVVISDQKSGSERWSVIDSRTGQIIQEKTQKNYPLFCMPGILVAINPRFRDPSLIFFNSNTLEEENRLPGIFDFGSREKCVARLSPTEFLCVRTNYSTTNVPDEIVKIDIHDIKDPKLTVLAKFGYDFIRSLAVVQTDNNDQYLIIGDIIGQIEYCKLSEWNSPEKHRTIVIDPTAGSEVLTQNTMVSHNINSTTIAISQMAAMGNGLLAVLTRPNQHNSLPVVTAVNLNTGQMTVIENPVSIKDDYTYGDDFNLVPAFNGNGFVLFPINFSSQYSRSKEEAYLYYWHQNTRKFERVTTHYDFTKCLVKNNSVITVTRSEALENECPENSEDDIPQFSVNLSNLELSPEMKMILEKELLEQINPFLYPALARIVSEYIDMLELFVAKPAVNTFGLFAAKTTDANSADYKSTVQNQESNKLSKFDLINKDYQNKCSQITRAKLNRWRLGLDVEDLNKDLEHAKRIKGMETARATAEQYRCG